MSCTFRTRRRSGTSKDTLSIAAVTFLVLLPLLVGCSSLVRTAPALPTTGYVIYVEGDSITTDLSKASPVRKGDLVVIFVVESEVFHPVTGSLVKVRFRPIGVARIEEVGRISSQAKILQKNGLIEVGAFVRLSSQQEIPDGPWWEEAPTWYDVNRTTALNLGENELLLGFSFDEGIGSVVGDASAYKHRGTIRGTATWVDGKHGTGLYLDGSSYVEVDDPSGLGIHGTDFTLAAWVKFANVGPQMRAILAHDGDGNKWIWGYSNFSSYFHINTDQGRQTWLRSDNWWPKPIDRWYHLAFVRQGSRYIHYLDGQEIGSGTFQEPIPAAIGYTVTIGIAERGFFLDGTIDDAVIIKRALSKKEIRNLMDHGLTAPGE